MTTYVIYVTEQMADPQVKHWCNLAIITYVLAHLYYIHVINICALGNFRMCN